MQSQYLVHAPSDSVSHHRVAQRLFDAHSKAVIRQAITPRENHERRTRTPSPLTVNGVVFRAPHQPPLARQIPLPRRLGDRLFLGHFDAKRV